MIEEILFVMGEIFIIYFIYFLEVFELWDFWDFKDVMVLAMAIVFQVDVIISGDIDLFVLEMY